MASGFGAARQARGGGLLPVSAPNSGIRRALAVTPGLDERPQEVGILLEPGGSVPDPDDPEEVVADAAVLGLRTTINY